MPDAAALGTELHGGVKITWEAWLEVGSPFIHNVGKKKKCRVLQWN